MKGTIRSIRVVGLLLGLVAGLGSSHPAQAQKVVHCTFVLPFDVEWQGRTLPAGEYHFTAPLESPDPSGSLSIRDAQNRPKMVALPVLFQSGAEPSGESALIIVNHNGKRYVRSLELGPTGTTREYAVPSLTKAEKRELGARPQVVRIQVAGNRS